MSKIIKKGIVERKPGKMYFFDKSGNLCEADMKNSNNKTSSPVKAGVPGMYLFQTKKRKYKINIAGEEKQNSTSQAFYLMDSDPSKPELGSVIVKNNAKSKLLSGKTISAVSGKTKEPGKLTKI